MTPANILPHNFRGLLRLALVCALLGGAALCARAQPQQQPPPPPPGEEETVRVDTNLIVLNVGVADRRGSPVLNLSQGDFSVYEDGVRQQIVSFEPASAPFSLVLLLDVSGSTQNFRATLKQSALRFVDALHPEDRVAVVIFNAKTKTRADFTTDRKKIAFAITDIPNERGDTHLYQALQYSLGMLAKEGKRRKAVVVLTDGVDTANRQLDGRATADAQTSEAAVATVKPDENAALRAVLDAADRQGVTIYPLALPSGDPKRLLPLTPQQSAIYTAARVRMNSLAERTGGRLHEINRVEDIGRLYAEVAADMRTLYSIVYQSSNTRPRDGRWRKINVEVTRSDTIARARPGYYAR